MSGTHTRHIAQTRQRPTARVAGRGRSALTLIELLVVVTVIVVLLSLLMPVLSSARNRMRALKCASNMRTVAFEFQLFAEGHTAAAAARGHEPFYMAPSVADDDGPYADNEYWLPSLRHGGQMNVAFVGGHVVSTSTPQTETWDWQFQAEVGW